MEARVGIGLQVQPEFRRGAEVETQPQGVLHRHGAAALHELRHGGLRDAGILGDAVLGEPERLDEFFGSSGNGAGFLVPRCFRWNGGTGGLL